MSEIDVYEAMRTLRAVRRLRPFAVDVSGGVEASPGVKDAEKIARFIDEVNRVSIAERTG